MPYEIDIFQKKKRVIFQTLLNEKENMYFYICRIKSEFRLDLEIKVSITISLVISNNKANGLIYAKKYKIPNIYVSTKNRLYE